jgi:alpha-methylacyl-CoA racemase
MGSGPLDGIRVLEFAQVYAGPFAGLLLADMGASVIKVESFDGDPWRHFYPFAPFESVGFHAMNRGKRSIALDLKHPAGLQVVERLLPDCDVVLTNLRPDVPKRLGIDYESVRRFRPDVVYALGTAWGSDGPAALEPAFDLIAQAASGLMASAGRMSPRGNPTTPGGTPYADYFTGYSLALAICAALVHRARTGEGQFVETSMLVNSMMIQNATFTVVPAADKGRRAALKQQLDTLAERGASYAEQQTARRGGAPSEIGSPFYRTYLTRDGAIAVGGLSAQFNKRMRDALGVAETDKRGQEGLTEHIECLIREQPTAHWLGVFQVADVPVTRVNFIEQMDEHPQVQSNGYTVTLEHPISGAELQVGPVHKMSATPPAVQGASPPLGAHTREVLGLAGYTDAEIDALYARDVVR